MTLHELISQRLAQLDDSLVIYAAPKWSAASKVVVAREPADGSLPAIAAGKTYLLTVLQAKRVIAARRHLRPGCAITAQELADAIVYFAIYDVHEPVASLESAEIPLSLAV